MMNTWNPAEIMERLNRLEAIVKSIPTPVDVVANPEGEASTDLTKLTVGETIYGIPEPTTVEANPEGEASTDLTKIKIGETNYNVKGGAEIVSYITNVTTANTGEWTVKDKDGNDLTYNDMCLEVFPLVETTNKDIFMIYVVGGKIKARIANGYNISGRNAAITTNNCRVSYIKNVSDFTPTP